MTGRRIGYAVWIISISALYFFENNTGTRILLIASIVIPAASLFCAFFTAGRIAASISGPDQLRKKENGLCQIKLVGSRLISGCVVLIRAEISDPLVGEINEITVENRGDRADIPVSAIYCGRIGVRIIRGDVRDWFGLGIFRASGILNEEHRLLVFPGADPKMPDARADFSDRQEDSADRTRLYIPGDPVKKIHWKLSAKTGQILVREGEENADDSLMLLLETSLKDPAPDRMDAAVEALFSFSGHLAADHICHHVVWYDYGREELKILTVRQTEDEMSMQEEVLKSASSLQGNPVSQIIRQYYPEVDEENICLIDPNDFTTAESSRSIMTE